jgi:hypothetical protein
MDQESCDLNHKPVIKRVGGICGLVIVRVSEFCRVSPHEGWDAFAPEGVVVATEYMRGDRTNLPQRTVGQIETKDWDLGIPRTGEDVIQDVPSLMSADQTQEVSNIGALD